MAQMTLPQRATARYLCKQGVDAATSSLKVPKYPIIEALFGFKHRAITRAVTNTWGDDVDLDDDYVIPACKRRPGELTASFVERIRALSALPSGKKDEALSAKFDSKETGRDVARRREPDNARARRANVVDVSDDSDIQEEVRVVMPGRGGDRISSTKSSPPSKDSPSGRLEGRLPKRSLSPDSKAHSVGPLPKKVHRSSNEASPVAKPQGVSKGKEREAEPVPSAFSFINPTVAASSERALPPSSHPAQQSFRFSFVPRIPMSPVPPVPTPPVSAAKIAAQQPEQSYRPVGVPWPHASSETGVLFRSSRPSFASLPDHGAQNSHAVVVQAAVTPASSAAAPSQGPVLGTGTQDMPANDLVTWLRNLRVPLDKHLGIFETMGIHSVEDMRLMALTPSKSAEKWLIDHAMKLGLKAFDVVFLTEGLERLRASSRP